MRLIQRIKCYLGIHEFEELEFMVNKGQWNNVWTRKGQKHNRIVKTNNVHSVTIRCKHCGKALSWYCGK